MLMIGIKVSVISIGSLFEILYMYLHMIAIALCKIILGSDPFVEFWGL